jgi:hypothetical protein
MRNFSASVIFLFLTAGTCALAQENSYEGKDSEISVSIAHTVISDQGVPNAPTVYNTVHFGKGWSFEGNYARRLMSFRWGNLSAEVPVIFNPDEDLNFGLNQVPLQYSSIFVTPAAKVTLLPGFAFSPWVSFGGGLAHVVASKNLVFGGTNSGHRVSNSGALEAGIGLDTKIPGISFFRLRFEARDIWTGEPPINVDTGHNRQHNYFLGGGPVFRF